MSNINCSKAILHWNCHQDLIVFSHKSLIFCKFVRCYIDSTELTFTAITVFKKHKILIKNSNKKHKQLNIFRQFKLIKKMIIQSIKQTVCWHHNTEEVLILQKVVTDLNNDLLILHSRDTEHKEKDTCVFCQNSLDFFWDCVINFYFNFSMSLSACSNCSWERHLNRCSFCKFSQIKEWISFLSNDCWHIIQYF